MGLMVLMGCSADSELETSEMKTAAVEVVSFVTGYDEANRAYESNRAWAIPTGFVAYGDGIQPIGIAFTQNGVDPAIGTGESPKPMIGSFFKSGEKWRTDLENIEAGSYQLYGYIPHLTAIDYSITDYDGANGSYSTGAIMTLQNVPTVMPNDLCVVIGAKHGYDKEHDGDNTDPRTNRLRQGDFSFTAAGSATGNYVFLLFDHLYAALRIRMRMHDDYAALRTIKLKSLQLGTMADASTTRQKTDITISLQTTDGSVSPITGITYAQPDTYPVIDGTGLEFWSDPAGTALTTDFQPFIGHFMPTGITKLILTSTYDVYDRKGNLIRLNCKATNTMALKDMLTDQTVTERGKRYTINMTIQPTYLYMLSEPDLDNPTVIIN